MPLIQPSIPVLQAFRGGLLDLADPNDQALALLHGVQEGHRIYTLGLRDILTGTGLSGATLAGWQFIASNASSYAAASVTFTAGGQALSMGSLSSSASGDTTIQKLISAIQSGGLHPLFQQPGAELRLLKIPAVLVEAAWLKPALGDADLVAPYLTVSRSLDLGRWYPGSDFLGLLKPLASKFLVLETVTAANSKP
jgi:hypothetical protein